MRSRDLAEAAGDEVEFAMTMVCLAGARPTLDEAVALGIEALGAPALDTAARPP